MKPIMSERLLQQLQQHEGKWVVLFGTDDDMEKVAVGEDAADASEKAAEQGYDDPTLLKVLPANAAYVPLA